MTKTVFKNSEQWTLSLEEDTLLAIGGTDEVYEFDRLSEEQCRKLFQLWKNENWTERHKLDDPELLDRISQLERTGIIYRAVDQSYEFMEVGFSWIGEKVPDVMKELNDTVENGTVRTSPEGDIVIVFRSGKRLQEVPGQVYPEVTDPHLLVDAANHHTLSFGPFVIPDQTACLQCMVERINQRWPDPEPPESPRALRNPEWIASFLRDRIDRFRKTGCMTALLEQAWTINIDTLENSNDQIFRVPNCPECAGEERTGKRSASLKTHEEHV